VRGWEFPKYPEALFFTVGLTTITWITTMLLTKPESMETLMTFYKRIQPDGNWAPVQRALGIEPQKGPLPWLFLSWGGAITMTYCLLFGMGKIIFQEYGFGVGLLAIAIISFLLMRLGMKKAKMM
jgi:solute:Na+ symporter, SSS family